VETPLPLNPAQQRVIDALGRGGERVALPDDFGERLRVGLTDGLTEIAGHLDAADPVWISKHALATIHTCEAHHQAMSVDFAWTVPTARGSVAHKAIELAVHWKGAPLPGDLVDEALARLVDQDDGLGRFVAGLGPADVAELRAIAIDRVSKFQECFPPLKPAWVPVTESKARVELFDGALVLAAKTDLTLGRPGEKVIVDFKSGRVHAHHGDDLRYYALIETIRIAAPRKLASYELDSARLLVEEVRDTTLYAALRRTIDGVTAIVELRAGREPRKRAGPACRWCPVLAECAEGQADRARSADLATGDLSPEDW
jgi:PD-(D/E)XK nuclease superfamily